MNAREFIQQKREKIADEITAAEARLGEMKAQDALLYDLLRELPEESAPAPVATAPAADAELKTGRDADRRTQWTRDIATFLEDGPKGQGDICAAVECSDPTTVGILKLSPFFERKGDGRFAPWTLTQQGRLWLAQQGERQSNRP